MLTSTRQNGLNRRVPQFTQMGTYGQGHNSNEATAAGPRVMQYPQGMPMSAAMEGFATQQQQTQAAQRAQVSTQAMATSASAQGLQHEHDNPAPQTGYPYSSHAQRLLAQQQLGPAFPMTYGSPNGTPASYGYEALPSYHTYPQYNPSMPQTGSASPGQTIVQPQTSLTGDVHPFMYPSAGQGGVGAMQAQPISHRQAYHQAQVEAQAYTQRFQQYLHEHNPAFHAAAHTYATMAPPTPTPPPPRTIRSKSRVNDIPEIQKQGSAALSHFEAFSDTQAPLKVSHPPTTEMDQFVEDFRAHYRNCPPALDTFEALCMNFNRRIINPIQFYGGIYRILCRTKSIQLLESFKLFIPVDWKEQDLKWFHDGIEQEMSHKAAEVMEDGYAKRGVAEEDDDDDVDIGRVSKARKTLSGSMGAVGQTEDDEGDVDGESGEAQDLPRSVQEVDGDVLRVPQSKKSLPEQPKEALNRLIVKLPVRFDKKAARKARSRKQISQQDVSEAGAEEDVEPLLSDGESAQLLSSRSQGIQNKGTSMSKKKKVPLNGFRTRSQLKAPASQKSASELSVGADVDTRAQTSEPMAGSREEQPPSSPPTAPDNNNTTSIPSSPQASPANTSTPTQHANSKAQPKSTPITTPTGKKDKSLHSNTPAAEVPHIGPVYPTRRAVLARTDKPYIHALCGLGFMHPQDVKHHHASGGARSSGCPAMRGKKGGGGGGFWRVG